VKGYGTYASYGKPTGKVSIITGCYKNKTRYPQRKDGTHNYEAIASNVLAYVKSEVAAENSRKAMKTNSSDSNAIKEEFNLPSYNALVSPANQEGERSVVINLGELYTKRMSCTPEQARKVLTTLRELGFKLSY